jgi:hypothetical protein
LTFVKYKAIPGLVGSRPSHHYQVSANISLFGSHPHHIYIKYKANASFIAAIYIKSIQSLLTIPSSYRLLRGKGRVKWVTQDYSKIHRRTLEG